MIGKRTGTSFFPESGPKTRDGCDQRSNGACFAYASARWSIWDCHVHSTSFADGYSEAEDVQRLKECEGKAGLTSGVWSNISLLLVLLRMNDGFIMQLYFWRMPLWCGGGAGMLT